MQAIEVSYLLGSEGFYFDISRPQRNFTVRKGETKQSTANPYFLILKMKSLNTNILIFLAGIPTEFEII